MWNNNQNKLYANKLENLSAIDSFPGSFKLPNLIHKSTAHLNEI